MGKQTKPYPTFPLTPHVRGGWAKSYHGQQFYFRQRDPYEALAEFQKRKREVDSGRYVPKSSHRMMTVQELVTRYLAARHDDALDGGLAPSTYEDYEKVLQRICNFWGADRVLANLHPEDFAALARHFGSPCPDGRSPSVHTMARNIQLVRCAFRYAYRHHWIPRQADFGDGFSKPLRPLAKHTAPLRTADLHTMLGVATGELRAIILVMANCAYTIRDCALLSPSMVTLMLRESGDASGGLIRFPQRRIEGRRGVERAAFLWPETARALQLVVQGRQGGDRMVFTAARGGALCANTLAQQFAALCGSVGVGRRGLTAIRAWFGSVAEKTGDAVAMCRVMGLVHSELPEAYFDECERAAIERLSMRVRAELLP
jgi:hypothetical protein